MYEIMKRYILYLILLWLAGGFFTACEKEEPPFFDSKANGVYFDYAEQRELSASVNFADHVRSEEHTSELQSRQYLVCRLLLEKKQINPSLPYSHYLAADVRRACALLSPYLQHRV